MGPSLRLLRIHTQKAARGLLWSESALRSAGQSQEPVRHWLPTQPVRLLEASGEGTAADLLATVPSSVSL